MIQITQNPREKVTKAERDAELGLEGEMMPQVFMEVREGRNLKRSCVSRGLGAI